MKDHIKPQERLRPWRRYNLTVDQLAYSFCALIVFAIVTGLYGIRWSLALAAIFGSGLMVYRWHKRRWP